MELVAQTRAFRHDAGGDVEQELASQKNVQNPFRKYSLWTCGFYYLIYQGVEGKSQKPSHILCSTKTNTRPASLTDWIVVFLIRARHVDATTAASASSVFWLGMTLGRYTLSAVSDRIGLRLAVSCYIAVAVGAQIFLIILVQLSGILVVLGIGGYFLAPLFPSGILVLASQTEPRDRVSIVASVIAMGQVGGAVVPFGLGLLATHVGIEYLLHVTLGLSAILFMLWAAVTRV